MTPFKKTCSADSCYRSIKNKPNMILTATVVLAFSLTSIFAEQYSVIVIGAGSAGVAAAAKLLENNITNIAILEAEGRIGGRIHSVFFGDAIVELGAEWCHGKTNNIVYELASPFVELKQADENTLLLYSNGELDSEFRRELQEFLFADYRNEPEEGNFITMQDFVIARYESSVKKKYENQTEKLKIALETKRLLEQYVLSVEGAFYPNNATAISDFAVDKNDSDYSWQGIGYKTILDILIHKFPNESNALPFYEKLKLNEEVVKIRWNETDEDVVVDVNNGHSYRAKHVIFTPSLNVLKQDHKKLFLPELPKNKQEAMLDIGMDAVMKIHFHFAEKFWPNDFNGYSFIWNEETLQEVQLQQTKFDWITNICYMLPADKNPNVLTAWITGPAVIKAELLSNEEIAEGVRFLLRKFLNNSIIPDKILKSGWHNNPHFRGVYSYQTVKAQLRRPSPEVVLSEPLNDGNKKNIICFAGEATHPYFYSTVHGAIETGYREAQRIALTMRH